MNQMNKYFRGCLKHALMIVLSFFMVIQLIPARSIEAYEGPSVTPEKTAEVIGEVKDLREEDTKHFSVQMASIQL